MRATAAGAAHEVEVKYRVADESALLQALQQRGVLLSAPVRQDDQAYAPAGWRYGMSKIGVPFARPRTQDGRHLFTVKRPVDNELACLEHQTVVVDREQMHAALVTMGFTPTVRIVKTRRSGRWGTAALCPDTVDDLGTFVELEIIIRADESGPAVQDRLDQLMLSLGVRVQRTTDTYDSLIRAATAPRRAARASVETALRPQQCESTRDHLPEQLAHYVRSLTDVLRDAHHQPSARRSAGLTRDGARCEVSWHGSARI